MNYLLLTLSLFIIFQLTPAPAVYDGQWYLGRSRSSTTGAIVSTCKTSGTIWWALEENGIVTGMGSFRLGRDNEGNYDRRRLAKGGGKGKPTPEPTPPPVPTPATLAPVAPSPTFKWTDFQDIDDSIGYAFYLPTFTRMAEYTMDFDKPEYFIELNIPDAGLIIDFDLRDEEWNNHHPQDETACLVPSTIEDDLIYGKVWERHVAPTTVLDSVDSFPINSLPDGCYACCTDFESTVHNLESYRFNRLVFGNYPVSHDGSDGYQFWALTYDGLVSSFWDSFEQGTLDMGRRSDREATCPTSLT